MAALWGALLLLVVSGKLVKRSLVLSPSQQWTYLTKFAMSAGTGHWSLRLSSASGPFDLHMSVYELSNWAAASAGDCQDRVSLFSGDKVATVWRGRGDPVQGSLKQSRTTVWYFAVSDCSGNLAERVKVEAEIEITDSDGSQYSAEDAVLIDVCAWPLPLLFGLLVFNVKKALERTKKTDALEPNLATLVFAVACEAMGLLLETVHLSVYAYNGSGLRFLSYLAQLCVFSSRFALYCIVLLKSSGWTLRRAVRPDFDSFVPAIGAIGVVEVSVVLLDKFTEDSRFSSFEGLPGFVLTATRLGMCAWLLVACWRLSRTRTGGERRFARLLGVCGCAYFLAAPAIGIYSKLLPSHEQKRTVLMGRVGTQVLAFCVLSRLYSYSQLCTVSAAMLPQGVK